MANTWAKVKFFWHNLLGQAGVSLSPLSTDSTGDYSASYLSNGLESNGWKAASTAAPCHIILDTNRGNVDTAADYLIISGHNFGSISATLALQYSDDNVTYYNAFTPVQLRSDKTFLKEFTRTASYRFWKLLISSNRQPADKFSAPPSIAIASFGLKAELDYADASFDPRSQTTQADVNLSQGGYVTGTHTRYIERSMSLAFNDMEVYPSTRYLGDGTYTGGGSITGAGSSTEGAVYERLEKWWNENGMKNFFVAWETANSPDDVFLMRSDGKYTNPLKNGGAFRDITLNLLGRKES